MPDKIKKPKSPARPVNAKRSPAVKPVEKPAETAETAETAKAAEAAEAAEKTEKPKTKPTAKPLRSVYDEIAEKRKSEGKKASYEPPAEDDNVKIYKPPKGDSPEDDVKIFKPKSKKQKKAPVKITDEPKEPTNNDDNFDVEVPPPKDRLRGFWILLITVLSVLCAGTLLFYLYLIGVFDGFINML